MTHALQVSRLAATGATGRLAASGRAGRIAWGARVSWIQWAWAVLAVCGVVFFLDTPFRTFRQNFVAQRSRERLILFTFELDLVALWAIARFYLGWERPLAPVAAAGAAGFAGLLVAAAGVGLAVWAKLALGRWFSGTFGVKRGHELVTAGPYGVTRHPIYTGIILTVVAGGLVWNSLLTLALGLLLAVPFFFHTVYEETLFEAHFGAAYRDYQERVPRLVPFAKRRGA